jgi:radical SAM protein with 4Fe4S-binding SPASM domain
MFDNHVYKNENVLYNSITQKYLPIDSDEETFRKNYFLLGQKIDSIKKRLSSNPYYVQFNLIPSWECNLRCSHCCVMTSLKKNDENNIDEYKFSIFLNQYFEKFNKVKNLELYFLGGEPLLKPQKILSLMDAGDYCHNKFAIEKEFGMTTNLSIDLQEEHIDVINRLTKIGVSIDGFEQEHNQQRKAYTNKNVNPFKKTISNLKKLIALGFREKIYVQAALQKEIIERPNYCIEFVQYLTSLGVKLDKTRVGSIFPTEVRPEPQESWLNYRKKTINIQTRPCCKYRYMANFKIDSDNTIYDNFYKKENSRLGTLDNTVDEICEKNLELIFSDMPSLNDKTCMDCPVLGYCWGGCVSGHIYIGNKPSLSCSKKELIPYIQNLADTGKLIEKTDEKYLKSLL